MTAPRRGTMVYWRYLSSVPKGSPAWSFGFVSDAGSHLLRMGRYNGDYYGGVVVSDDEIEWRRHP